MKKTVSLILALVMLLAFIPGCTGTDENETTSETAAGSSAETSAQTLGAEVNVWWFSKSGDFQTTCKIGETPVPPQIESTVNANDYIYTLTGWDKELAPLTDSDVTDGNVYYNAKYTKEQRKYCVTFVADGKTVATKEYTYGETIDLASVTVPEKEGFKYCAWTCDSTVVTGDCTLTAGYTNKITYTIADGQSYIKDGVYYMTLNTEEHSSGRSTPASINTGSGYDSLIFYDEEDYSVLPDPDKTVDEMLSALNISASLIFTAQQFASVSNESCTTNITVSDSKMPFTTAKHVVITAKGTADYNQRIGFTLPANGFSEGDSLLVSCWIRVNSSSDESGCCKLRFFNEEPTTWSKNLNCSLSHYADGEWFRFMTTFTAKDGYVNFGIALAGCIQSLDIAGLEIRNCGTTPIDDIPKDSIASLSTTLSELYTKDVQWRKEAWDRIEKIRMGNVTVNVTDANGNPISGADVKIEMTEHDFKWGTCIAEILMQNSTATTNYNKALSVFFNSAVSGTGTKWACYEREPQRALTGHTIAQQLGITYFRGHCLYWDSNVSKATDTDGSYKFLDYMPERLWKAGKEDDEAAAMQYFDEWFKLACETFSYVGEWDVLNEPNANKYFIKKYGMEMVKYWFDLARKYAPAGTKLYVNETSITNANSVSNVNSLCKFIDQMIEVGTSFDGIGIQGHTDELASPVEFYNNVMTFTKYGKELKITEFDTGRFLAQNKTAEASWVRDTIILMFSIEEMDGFFMWGFWDKMSTYENAPLFDENWNLKLTGEQYLDLVYNQWWTRESGKTAANGKYTTRAYYGTYDITVTVNGKTVTQSCTMKKGETGNFTIVVK